MHSRTSSGPGANDTDLRPWRREALDEAVEEVESNNEEELERNEAKDGDEMRVGVLGPTGAVLDCARFGEAAPLRMPLRGVPDRMEARPFALPTEVPRLRERLL